MTNTFISASYTCAMLHNSIEIQKFKESAWAKHVNRNVSECAFDRIKEAFELVAQDEAEKMSVVQEIMLRSTDFLRRCHSVIPVPELQQFPLRLVGLWVKNH